jgi:CotH kinase protein
MKTTKLAGTVLFFLSVSQYAEPAAAQSDPTASMYDPTRIISIAINMDADHWNQLRAQERTFVSLFGGDCLAQPFDNPFSWFPAQVMIDGQLRNNIGVRKKGFLGSLDRVKPALKIDLSQFQANSAVYGLKKLTLNNAKQDPSLIRQCVAYQLFARAGVPAPRCNFAQVSVNGQNVGTYVNVEEVRKPLLGRSFSNTSGNLYEGTFSDFHPALINTFEMQSNEDTNDGSDIRAVMDALRLSDSQLLATLGALVDLDAFMTFWAMEGLIGHWDGYSSNRNNFYLYRDPTSAKFYFIPWGADMILADGSPIAARDPAANTAMFAYSAITRRLVDFPEMRARYKERMQALLSSVWNETSILAEITRMDALLRPVAGDLTSGTATVREFVNGRRARVVDALGGAPPNFPPLSIISPCLVQNGKVAGSFAASWGTSGMVPPFQTGFAALYGRVSAVPLNALTGAADAGLSPTDPNPHLGWINLYLKRADGSFVVMPFRVDPTQLTTGATLLIDGKQVDASLVFTDGVTIGGFLDRGKLNVYSSWIAPGGRVCGTFEANTYFFSSQDLAKDPRRSDVEGRDNPNNRGVVSGTEQRNAEAHLDDVIEHCLPRTTSNPARL